MAKRPETTEPAADPNVRNPNMASMGKDAPDFDKWSEEQIGFAPYWKPQIGKWFFGAPIGIDERDPKFVRFLFLAYADTPCQRGPADEESERAEQVVVPKGETFSLSVYYALKEVFTQYLQWGEQTGKPVPVRVDALRTVPTKNQPECWQFRARISPEMKKTLTEWRMKNRKQLGSGATTRPGLED